MTTTLTALLPLISRIADNRSGPESLSVLAERVGLSPWQLQRSFSRVVGESPARYAARLRLECAVVLLREPLTVLDVALRLGFESGSGFTRAFTRHFGQSPGRYRKVLANQAPTSNRQRHDVLVQNTGPCVSLYRNLPNPKRRQAILCPTRFRPNPCRR